MLIFRNPPLRLVLRSNLCNWIQQQRGVRPTIKIGKDKYQLTIDLKDFQREDLRVKARPEYVIVEGKQEKKTKKGYVIRQFVRKYKLPYGCRPESIKVNLSPSGVLTVTAPRDSCDKNLPCESVIPITSPEVQDQTLKAVQQRADEKDQKKDGKS